MAKSRSTTKTSSDSTKNLASTLKVDGETYNITATTAEKVANKLKIIQKDGITENYYDGSKEVTVDLSENIDTLLKDLKKACILYEWDGSSLTPSYVETGDETNICGISIVRGSESALDGFMSSNTEAAKNSLPSLPSFIYISEDRDTLNIYLCTRGTGGTGSGTKIKLNRGYSYASPNTNPSPKITFSTSAPDSTSGNEGDIWIKYKA